MNVIPDDFKIENKSGPIFIKIDLAFSFKNKAKIVSIFPLIDAFRKILISFC